MAAGTAHLSSSKLNLGLLRDFYRREFLETIDKCLGTKAIVWDDGLTGPFGLIAEYSLLKDHEVEKMFPLRTGSLPASNVQSVVFLTRPKLELMEKIAQNLHHEETKGGYKKEFHLVFVPRRSLLCERKLKEKGVYGSFTNVDEFNMTLIPFDSDLLSMEMNDCFKECYVDSDHTSMYFAAQSLMTLQGLYGTIQYIHGKGECAKQVVHMLGRMKEEVRDKDQQVVPQIDTLLILDRSVDLLTPLLSQLTYEGLIDEIFGINNTAIKLPGGDKGGAGGPSTDGGEAKKVVLNSGDTLFAELRDKNFNAVGSIVSKKAKTITAEFDERHAAKTIGEMKQFVSKLPHLQASRQSLATHTTIAELVKEFTDTDDFIDALRCQQEFINGLETDKVHPLIEECISKAESLTKVLRLLCIQSLCGDGLKPKVLEWYKREIVNVYGFQHTVTLHQLEKVGLLKAHGARSYQVLRKSLRLIVEDVNEQNPSDIAYVYSGYAPLSVRLAQYLCRPGWRSVTEVLNMLPGPRVEEVQQIPPALRKRRSSITSSQSSTGEPKLTLVYFLGGVTFAEIAALRFLAQQDDGGTDYIIATTSLLSGDRLIGSLTFDKEKVSLNPF